MARLMDYINTRLDELFPRPWHDQWQQALARGWQPDDPLSYCRRCGSTVHVTAQSAGGCPFCRGRRFPWRKLTRLCAYDEPADEWITQFKFHRQWRWGPVLGEALGRAMTPPDAGDGPVVVCPVPLHPLRRIRRGYNQAGLVARAVAKAHGLPMVPLLRRWVWTPPQSSQAVSSRAGNVRRVFTMVNVDLTGHRVWLVDDVKTTGATLAACARLLRQAGASSVEVAVVAVADPSGAKFQQVTPGSDRPAAGDAR